MTEFTETEEKLLHKLVNQELKIKELQFQLNQERKEKWAAQRKYFVGFELGKEVTGIIKDLAGLLKEEADGQGQGDDGKCKMEVMRSRIPVALNILKGKIEGLDIDKEVLNDLEKIVDILMLRKNSEPGNAADDQPNEVESEDKQSSPIVQYVQIFDIKR